MVNSLPLILYRFTMQRSKRIHSWTFVISVVHKRYATSCIFWSISLHRWYMFVFQHKDLEPIKEELTKNFSSMCDWFVDNKLSIHFGEDKTKSILFSNKNRKRKIRTLDMQYGDVKTKQTILKSNIFRLWVRQDLLRGSCCFESYNLNSCIGKTNI